jgi:hypothetical protein
MSSLSCKFASIVALPGMALLSSCGEVKVIKNNSFISSMNPVNEVVEVTIDKTSEIPVSCLNIKEPTFEPGLSVSDVERDVFNRAVIAHLAPIQIPIKEECRFAFQLQVAEYDIQTLLVASRLIVSLSAEIADDFDQSPVWAAQYRLTQNAGAIPLDPISMGFGAVAAAKNSSKHNKADGVYLAVRRLLMGLGSPQVRSPSIGDNAAHPNEPTFFDALLLWQEGKISQALEQAGKLYDRESMPSIGYEYGLMLESSGNEQQAAKVYSETALAQMDEDEVDRALISLRRLEKLNRESGGRYAHLLDSSLARALER